MIPGRYMGKRERNRVWRKTIEEMARIDRIFLDCIVFRDRGTGPEGRRTLKTAHLDGNILRRNQKRSMHEAFYEMVSEGSRTSSGNIRWEAAQE